MKITYNYILKLLKFELKFNEIKTLTKARDLSIGSNCHKHQLILCNLSYHYINKSKKCYKISIYGWRCQRKVGLVYWLGLKN